MSTNGNSLSRSVQDAPPSKITIQANELFNSIMNENNNKGRVPNKDLILLTTIHPTFQITYILLCEVNGELELRRSMFPNFSLSNKAECQENNINEDEYEIIIC